jgi:hypothetical protein
MQIRITDIAVISHLREFPLKIKYIETDRQTILIEVATGSFSSTE